MPVRLLAEIYLIIGKLLVRLGGGASLEVLIHNYPDDINPVVIPEDADEGSSIRNLSFR